MVRPIRPGEVAVKAQSLLPDFVVEVVNDLIIRAFAKSGGTKAGDRVHIGQYLIVEALKIAAGIPKEDRLTSDQMAWLNFEEVFRAQGWKIEYDRPGYNEDYEPIFTFTIPRNVERSTPDSQTSLGVS